MCGQEPLFCLFAKISQYDNIVSSVVPRTLATRSKQIRAILLASVLSASSTVQEARRRDDKGKENEEESHPESSPSFQM